MELNESWIQIISLFVANASFVIWFRAESRNDWRHMDTKLEAIHQEMKDFHARLCVIEERKQQQKTYLKKRGR